MGNYFTINMEENFKKNQEFIQTINKIKIERQIQLQYQLQERQAALQIAKNRDTCLWITAFTITATFGLLTGQVLNIKKAKGNGSAFAGKTIVSSALIFSHCLLPEIMAGFRRTKRPYLLMPLVPLGFTTLYYWDAAYGNKVHRIRMEAEHIMTHEADSLEWPCGLPSASQIEFGRIDDEEKKKIHPPLL